MTRESWGSRAGFILAAAGSAVGLGNLWRFPWMTAENGGAAFLVLYLAIILLVGVPGLLGELVIGRRAGNSPVGALRDLADSRGWGVVGHLPILTNLFLLSFYSVVGGWVLRYLVDAVLGTPVTDPGARFDALAFGPEAVAFHVVFVTLTGLIVAGGVRRGIERATKLMMPAIVVLLVGLAIYAGRLPGASGGYAFFLQPDLGYLRTHFVDVLLAAAGQALFTLSIGAGTMITYASYISDDRSLPADGTTIAVLNTVVGVLAGLVVLPLLFALVGGAGSSGPGALFVSLTGAFATLPTPAGRILAVAFFAVVALAALSSSISMLEIPVSFLVDEHGWTRRRATTILLGVFLITGSANALEPALFGFIADTLVNLLLTAGLTVFLLFAGWVLGADAIAEYERGAGPLARRVSRAWLLAIGIVLPLFLLFTLFSGVVSAAEVAVQHRWVLLATGAAALVAFLGLRHPRSVV